jgi:hypothetical protein
VRPKEPTGHSPEWSQAGGGPTWFSQQPWVGRPRAEGCSLVGAGFCLALSVLPVHGAGDLCTFF